MLQIVRSTYNQRVIEQVPDVLIGCSLSDMCDQFSFKINFTHL